MALSPGTRLGHYDVTALIGEGGMGHVWQATDTQLQPAKGEDVDSDGRCLLNAFPNRFRRIVE